MSRSDANGQTIPTPALTARRHAHAGQLHARTSGHRGGTRSSALDETRDMLHRRLRAASIMLRSGSTVFLVRDVFFPGSARRPDLRARPGLSCLLIATVAALSGSWEPRLRQLRCSS